MSDGVLILTGGTIGSEDSGGVLSAREGTESLLLKKYRERGGRMTFDVRRAANTLSENFDTAVLCEIARHVADAAKKPYRAAVVTSGTDNLGALAVYLGFALCTIKIPVFLISSQYILSDPRENGSLNLAAADTAARELPRGVYVLNAATGDKRVFVHAACRIGQCAAFTGDVESPRGYEIGYIEGENFVKNPKIYEDITEFYRQRADCSPLANLDVPSLGFGNVYQAYATPFCAPSLSEKTPGAVFLNLFHSGTASVTGEASVLPFLADCRGRDVPVFAAPAPKEGARYDTAATLSREGVRFLPYLTPLAAYIKLCVLFSPCVDESLRESALTANIAGEDLSILQP